MPELPSEITLEDIKYILDNPWYISEGEWNLQEDPTMNFTNSVINERLKLAHNDGYAKLWKTDSNQAIAILGGYLVENRTYETFFIASKHMEEYALKLSFEMRKILEEKAKEYKGCTLRLYSSSSHPKQLTWFRFLGFKHIPERKMGNSQYFEYKSIF